MSSTPAYRPSPSPTSTVIDLLLLDSTRPADTPVLIFEDGPEISRSQLRDLVEGFAGYLRDRVSPGSVVAIMMENRAEFLIACLAVIAVRAAFLPVNPASGRVDGTNVLRGARATLAVADEGGRAAIEAWRPDLPDLCDVITVTGVEPRGLPHSTRRFDLAMAECRPTDTIAIAFTSGTTGLPKGCMVDHRWALRTTDAALRVHTYGPDDRIFYPVKFVYLDGFNALLRAMRCGGAYVAARKFSVSRYWNVVRAHRVTILSTIASMPIWLLKAEPDPSDRHHDVRFAIQAHIPRELHHDLDRRWGFPWLENYGMMEAGLIARVPVGLADELRGSGSAGPPVADRTVTILGPDDVPALVGSLGEIAVSGPAMFRGYLDRPDATASLMRGGWLHTGDLGRLDGRGFLYVVGRLKDVVRRSGENVSPEEVEGVLRSHPAVRDVAVIGVPDIERGQELKAFIELVQADAAVPTDDLIAFCRARLSPYKVPRYFESVAALPRSTSMRVRKDVLRSHADPDQQSASVGSTASGAGGDRDG